MKKLFIVELKHCLDSIECKMFFLLLFIANITSYFLCVNNDYGISYQFIRSANENFILQGSEKGNRLLKEYFK